MPAPVSVETVVGTILARDHYAYVRLYYATRIAVAIAVILLFSLASNVFLAMQPVRYQYVMTDVGGDVIDMVPLDRPNMSDEDVLRWTVDAITRINTYDFANYRSQFQDAQRYLTEAGWLYFERALKQSGNFDAVLKNKFAVTAAPAGPAVLVNRQILQSGPARRFAWTVRVPILITYRSSRATVTQALDTQILVGRLPYSTTIYGVGIRQILAK